jgi:alkylation response protein AidB-like acyl-CoA dehydrogenase
MDFLLDDEQLAFRKAIIAFAQAELNPSVEQRDREESFHYEGWRKCAGFGLLGLPVPQEFGGMAADPLTMMVAMEALGFGCWDNGLVFAIGNHLFSCVVPIVKFGSAAQKAKYLPALAEGRFIGAHAMTEPEAGSDTASIRTTATRRGDAYVLNGRKAFITSGPIADLFVVFAKTSQGSGVDGTSAFLLEKTTPGFSAGPKASKMGLRTSPMSEIFLDDCAVPADNLLGPQGSGSLVFGTAVEWERGYLSAANLGAMKRQLTDCVRYATERCQFGRPIGQFQSLAHRLASIRVEIDLAELMLYKVGWLRTHNKPAFFESAAVKLFTSESYTRASLAALQMHGAFGYMADSGVERQVRDALASTIYAGTSEIQREIVASWMGLDLPRAATQGHAA